MLIGDHLAEIFLGKYKEIMAYLNDGQYPDSIEEYISLRSCIYENIHQIKDDMSEAIGQDFCRSIESGVLGEFAFLKRYKQGYILQHIETGIFY